MATTRAKPLAAALGLTLCWILSTAGTPALAGLLPTFSKDFLPKTIGPGSTTTLEFVIDNPDPDNPVANLAFVDNLPASVLIADPANAMTDCGGEALLDAPPGGSTITLSGGVVGADGVCAVTVDVTSDTVGTHTNVSGDLTHSVGNSGPAIADLVVDGQVTGFMKEFSPSSISEGASSTLIFTLDNQLSDGFFSAFFVVDGLPPGVLVATPSNVASDCSIPPTITASPGSSSITLSGAVQSGEICTVSVDVTAETAGLKGNSTGDFLVDNVAAGKANASLEVTRKFLRKIFIDDPTPPGGTVTLEFTLKNFDRVEGATDIVFLDDLGAALAGLEAVGLPLDDPCGDGSQLAGTSLLSFTGGELEPDASCTFSVELDVPEQAAAGSYLNTTSSVSLNRGGEPVVEDPASDHLVVAAVPAFTKVFTDDPVTAGGTVKLQFDITNTSPDSTAFDIAFEDVLIEGLPTALSEPGSDPCGDGSTATFVPLTNPPPPSDAVPARITLADGVLAAGESCSFEYTLNVAEDLTSGSYLNTTSQITATVGETSITGNPATDTLEVVAAPRLSKEFTDDPALPGGTVTLEFTLELSEEAPGGATDIEFTDDLDAVLTGLVAVGLPLSDVCGAGSEISGAGLLSFTGGSLATGQSCTFDVSLQMPAEATPGSSTNITSDVSAMSLGLAVASDPAEADLEIGGITFSKTFTDDPVLAGDTVNLEFSIENLSPSDTATGLEFFDDLSGALAGLVAIGLPINDPCGDGSTLLDQGGGFLLALEGGVLAPQTSCTFSVTLQVPEVAEVNDYLNTTSPLSGFLGATPFVAGVASDVLSVFEPLTLQKLFTDDPIPPGGTGSLEFTLLNASAQESITDISFTDDLDSILSGLAATGLPADDVCGAGSQITGTGVLSFTGGSLGPDESCSFSVQVEVPADAPMGTVTNTTSQATGTLGSLIATAPAAEDELTVEEMVCTAPDGESAVLANDTLLEPLSVTVCESIEVGPAYTVGAGGLLTLRTGDHVILLNGATVETGGGLAIGIDPDLQP